MIQLEGIAKSYNGRSILKPLNLDVPSGCVYGLLGPNGAGKTTTLRLLSRIILPDAGAIYFNGEKYQERHVKQIGYMPEERGLYKEMSVQDQINYIADLQGIKRREVTSRTARLLNLFNLEGVLNQPIKRLSKGTSQKVQFICTILHQPKLLILDEPFSGLDPVSSQALEKEILHLRNNGVAIILSTHRMDQVETICDKVCLLNQGVKMLEGKISEVKAHFKTGTYELTTNRTLDDALLAKYIFVSRDKNNYRVSLQDNTEASIFLQDILSADVSVQRFVETSPTMNDIFINIIKNNTIFSHPLNNLV
ncbi:ABC transporter ATP-binding protein [Hymenobacter sp. GOD-10R]|uniref:ABC transporter ATP-binding protein n=1 Tax=Hymenobacter sp. GOD-10R TaxID=3093922 RepID=UPI002D77F9F0|nr:ATP-binding cassette domain-containing protein [Hymenobacter sp. GOD-10R]WRQ31753.1 ATP-binding cassette domain-containing protein [Hymenobacter sp. GOD-10R]